MKYEVVALFDNNSTYHMDNILNRTCRKYKLTKNFPSAYIHLGTVWDIKIEDLDSIIHKVLKPYKKFKIQLNNNILVDENNKLISLKVENKGYITRISRNLNETLSLSGFPVKTQKEDEELYIPLANILNNKRNYFIKNNNFHPLWNSNPNYTFKINRIEVWKNSNNRRDSSIKKYELRDY
ncbi:hypothetical protein [Haloimpatiens lingqiaonensis]|uniref:hypothetical protein n=1 Tax=Haloimpatiens lingqiaonensis TaxID=1380675 RepID=UPI0010FE477B|nr:hypothetical protein [Haloimpatiens lingqiaonensis]